MSIKIEGSFASIEAIVNAVALYVEATPMEYAPFSHDMSKDEMVDHIINVHGHRGDLAGKSFSIYGTKVTKDEMIKWHDNAHLILDQDDMEVATFRSDRPYVRSERADQITTDTSYRRARSTVLPKMRHGHMAVAPLTEEQRAVVAKAREGKKTDGVLSATERKVLTQVVDNDFGSLKQEMRAFASDALMQRKKEIEADWDTKEKAIPDFATRATQQKRVRDEKARVLKAEYNASMKALDEAFQDDHRQVVKEAQDQGVTLTAKDERYYDEQSGENRVRSTFVATVEGRKEAIAAAEKENQAFLDRALMDLERQRLAAQRQVLLSGVPQGAMTILESIPDAKSLMINSKKESAANQIESSQNQS